jgi:hypothetical protein
MRRTGSPMVIAFRSMMPLSDCRTVASRAEYYWGEGNPSCSTKLLMTKLLCVAFVAAVMVPLGGLLFPYVSHQLSGMQFQAIEAVVSATLGFGISSVLG